MDTRSWVRGSSSDAAMGDRPEIELASLASSSEEEGSGVTGSRSSRSSLRSGDPFHYGDQSAADLPLSPSCDDDDLDLDLEHPSSQTQPPKTLGFTSALGLVIGLQIGSGIFSTPGLIAGVGSGGGSLVVWVVSGMLAWSGASSFGELGAALPENGGMHAYLRFVYGRLASFLFSWVGLLCLKPGGTAIIATVTAEYILALLAGHSPDTRTSTNPWKKLVTDLVAIACLAAASALVILGSTLATRVNDLLVVGKLGALAAVFAMGIFAIATGEGVLDISFRGTTSDPSAWAVALMSGLWAFDGWDNCCYVANEMVSPSRDIPRVVNTATPTVTAMYVLANIAYFAVLPLAAIQRTHAVALDFGKKVGGPIAAFILALAVIASSLGAILSTTFTTARLVAASADQAEIPRFLGRRHRGSNTPRNAVVFQLLLSAAYVLAGNFERLVAFYGIAAWLFFGATAFAVVLLRIPSLRFPLLQEVDVAGTVQPQVSGTTLHRPYTVPLLLPALFSIVALWLVLQTAWSAPVEGAIGLVFLAAGIPVYYLSVRKAKRAHT
ncbi:hypothetical protein PYCC9005_002849 [Savitreella phatthalungensis]